MQRARSWVSSPWRTAAVVLAVHVVWVAAFFATGHEVRDLIRLGPEFVTRSDASDVIKLDPAYDYPKNFDPARPGEGYDGQFQYFLAVDPANAKHYMDVPTYRYERPLYAMTARVLGLGDPDLIEWTLLLVNLAAVFLGTAAMAAWLARQGLAPAWGLAFGLTPGLLVSTQRDLTEPLGYALLAAALLLLDRRRGWLGAGILLALAGLARQTTLIFVPFMALWLLGRHGWRRAAGFAGVSVAPYLAWSAWVHANIEDRVGASDQFVSIPYSGFFNRAFEIERSGVSLLAIALPATIAIGLAVVLVRRRAAVWAALALAANALVFVVFNSSSNAFPARSRAAVGVGVAAVMCLPWLLRQGPRVRGWLTAAAALWFPMLAVVFVYGLFLDSA